MRLDQCLVIRNLVTTRAKAQDAIQEQRVRVNGKCISKNACIVEEEDVIEVEELTLSFASRAGFKLYDVLEQFQVDLQGRIVMDVGASTGGFSDVCLQQGAAYVYAIDVGKDQLMPSLRNHPKVCKMEGVNARYLETAMFQSLPDIACIDVSFISLKLVLPAVLQVLAKKEIVALVKPQFEAGKKDVGKQGIVKDRRVHTRVLQELQEVINQLGCSVCDIAVCSVVGRDGNQEYVIHIMGDKPQRSIDYKQIVKS